MDKKIEIKNKGKEQKNNEEKESEKHIDFKPLIDLLKQSLKDLNLEKILENNNRVKIEKIEAEKLQGSRNLIFWKWKFSKEFAIIFIILFTVVYLSLEEKIENSTIGTLLGSIIGYAIGNFNSKEKKN